MKIKCPNCGYEDEGNFCSQCGAPLPKSEISENKKETLENIKWTDKCPICKRGKLWPIKQKGLFGISSRDGFKCMNCQSVFLIINNKYNDKYHNN